MDVAVPRARFQIVTFGIQREKMIDEQNQRRQVVKEFLF